MSLLQYIAMGFLTVGILANVCAITALIWMFWDMIKGKKQ